MSMNWRKLKTGDPCPCCWQPIQLTDPDALRLLAMTADLLGLPEHSAAPKQDDVPPALAHRCEGCPDGRWQRGEHIDSLCCYHYPYDGEWVGSIKVCPMDTERVQ